MFPSLKYLPIDVAASIIEQCNGNNFEVSHKKLHKLLYFAQGWYLAYTKQRIFDEDIEAWAHGPVVRSVYDVYRRTGWQNILFPFKGNSSRIDKKTKDYLQSLLRIYGQRSADELERITHSEKPWLQARGNSLPHEIAYGVITPESMYKFFSHLKPHGSRSHTA